MIEHTAGWTASLMNATARSFLDYYEQLDPSWQAKLKRPPKVKERRQGGRLNQ